MLFYVFLTVFALHTVSATSERSDGCGKHLPAHYKPGHSHDMFLQVEDPVLGSVERKVRIHIPLHYDKDIVHPVVVDYHGWSGNSHGQEKDSHFINVADEDPRGFIVLTAHGMDDNPEGGSWGSFNCSRTDGPLGPPCDTDRERWGDISCYSSCPSCNAKDSCDWTSCHDDVLYTRMIIEAAKENFCVNTKSIHMSGVSNGGMFVYYAISQLSDLIASIAPVAGSPLIGFGDLPQIGVNLIDLHGRNDDTIPYDHEHAEGKGPHDSVISWDGYYYESKDQILGKWRAGQDCAHGKPWPTSMDGVTNFQCTLWENCIDSTEIVHCSANYGHDYPFGDTHQYIEGTRIIWDFMKHHRKI